MWKKAIAFILCVLLTLGCFAGCGEKASAPETTVATGAAVAEPEGEAGVLKVLTLGHSLAVDAGHMLNLVAHAEGYKEMKVGTLYYSGCPLNKHVEFLTNDSREYNPEVVGSSPASATRRKALLFSNSKASFLFQNLTGFHPKPFLQPGFSKPCLSSSQTFSVGISSAHRR